MSKRKIELDEHDEQLTVEVARAIADAIARAHEPAAVTGRIRVIAQRSRNKGRRAAIKRKPFAGFCEKSGRRISREIAAYDELEPHKSYSGQGRWVCQRANNSGLGTCGVWSK